MEGWFHPRSPPDGHHLLRGDGLGEKATVVAAATPAFVTDAARARLWGGRGLRGGALLQLLQEEGGPSAERTKTRDDSEAPEQSRSWGGAGGAASRLKMETSACVVGLQRSRSARNQRCAASVTTSPASAEKAANYNASAAVVNGYGAAAAFSPGALQPQLSLS